MYGIGQDRKEGRNDTKQNRTRWKGHDRAGEEKAGHERKGQKEQIGKIIPIQGRTGKKCTTDVGQARLGWKGQDKTEHNRMQRKGQDKAEQDKM